VKRSEAPARSRTRSRKKRILIFNFFAGILRRGIPLYVDNFCFALESNEIAYYQLRCPRCLRRLPRSVLNCLFVLFEQAVMPVAALWFDKAIYPYNSVAIVGVLSSRTAMVIHDLISSRGRNTAMSARYLQLTQAVFNWSRRDAIYVSQSTWRIAKRLRRFSKSPTFLFPNSFFGFMKLLSQPFPPRGDAVLLCSGWGKNKDVAGALRLYLESGLYRNRPLRILGMGGHTEIVDGFCADHPEVASRIVVLPPVDDREVVRTYETAAWTWVHSRAEGYGRSIAEARLCGSRVVASNIAAFREQADDATYLYLGLEEFMRAISCCEANSAAVSQRIPPEHQLLKTEIDRFIEFEG